MARRKRTSARVARVDVDHEPGARGLGVVTVRRIAEAVLRAERVVDAVLSVSFVSDNTMRRLNRRHLKREGGTDVIAFPLRDGRGHVVGDVYIAPAAARRSAEALGIPLREELTRLVVHGVLHAVGRNHPDGLARERSAMWRRQEALVSRLRAGAEVPAP